MEATLQAVKRSSRGKNEARRLRVSGSIPGVVYGAQKEGDAVAPMAVAVDPKQLTRILHSESGANTLITLEVEGEASARVLVKEFLLDPITHQMLHADFYRLNMDRKITVTVPVVLKGEPRGVKIQGGVLDFLHREIEVEVLPANIPDSVEIDVSEMNVGDSIHLREIAANASWTPTSETDVMLVHVITPKTDEAAAGEGAAGSEPEVIKKGKTEKEGDEKKKDDKKK